jgi:hypothetical protein
VKPFEEMKVGQKIVGLPFTKESGPWAWYAAIMVLPKNAAPMWAQLIVFGEGGASTTFRAWSVPPGTPPVLAWFEGTDVPASPEALFSPPTPGGAA